MRVLNLLTSGGVGGIEVLCRDIGRFSNVKNRFAFLYGKGSIYEQMKLEDYDVCDLNFGWKLSVKRIYKLIHAAKDCNIVVAHHDDPYLQIHFLILSFLNSKSKYISMIHHCYSLNDDNLHHGFLKKKLKNYILQKMFDRSDRMIFVSKAGYASYAPYFRIDKDKVRIVYNGISHELIENGKACCKQTVKDTPVYLCYVGRLVKLKGVDLLIEAAARLIDTYDIRLVIVGDGYEKRELEQLVKKYHLEDKVVFNGFQKDVRPYLMKADLFVYPSRTEIFGISLVEAMAFGNICIANSVGGIPEIIKNGVNGFLNDTKDVEGLMKAIRNGIALLGNEQEVEELRLNAKKTAKTFCISNTIQQLNDIYTELF